MRGKSENAYLTRVRRIAVACALLLFLFAACAFAPRESAAAEEEGSFVYLYAMDKTEEGEVRAYFTTAQVEQPYAAVPCDISVYVTEEGAFYYRSHYDVTFDSWEAARAALSAAPEEWGVTEDNLKIVFVYATIYRTLDSNAERSEAEGRYLHVLTATPEDGEVVFAAGVRGAEYESWYALLVGVAAAIIVVAAVLYVAARRAKCRKNQKRSIG